MKGTAEAERTPVARSALQLWRPVKSLTSLALRRGTLPCASCWCPRSDSEAEQPVRRAASFPMPVVERTTVARSALRLWEPGNPLPSLALLRSALRRGGCWDASPSTEAGQLAPRAAPFTMPSSAQPLQCSFFPRPNGRTGREHLRPDVPGLHRSWEMSDLLAALAPLRTHRWPRRARSPAGTAGPFHPQALPVRNCCNAQRTRGGATDTVTRSARHSW